ncbi:LuxR C-terminal-related transcriptional regulator [Virgibacillus salinus]|uniref:Regulatory protein, luxR family n=1 Tax=Virgibacillus salinus TaxID=553311 RepID=A0A1H0Z668_9BACI|nr:LuxR C-terminal-related transcriptional regulator [Virgibacillus salinus]SDQ22945.1 regulatory protein, luxR family [Virgibacillus salinus]
MNQNIEVLKEILDISSERFMLSVITTDVYGEPVLPIKGDNRLCTTLLHQQHDSLLAVMKKTLKEAKNIKNPLVYEIWPGIHTIIAPVTSGGTTYFLWAGLMIEEETKHLVKKQLENNYPDVNGWERVLDETPILTIEKKREWISWINKLIKLSSAYSDERSEYVSYQIYNDLLMDAFQNSDLELNALMGKIFGKRNDFDFMGLAEKREEETYSITSVSGEAAQGLLNAEFSVGEGFLGRVLITGDNEYWENIKNDPRSYFFNKFQFHPAALYCFPFTKHDGSLALFFGGHITRNTFSKELEYAKTLAIILENSLLTGALTNENTQQHQRLSSLVEVCKMMVTRPEYKRIIYILVDISLSLVEGPFSCMVLKDSTSGKMKLVSRGDHNENMGVYAQDVINRYYNDSQRISTDVVLKNSSDETRWEHPVIECPLFYKDELLGVLCVGTNSMAQSRLNEDMKFLQTLSIIGGTTLQLAQNQDGGKDDKQVYSLYKATGQFDPAAFVNAKKASQMAGEFTGKLGLSSWNVQDLINSCLLFNYNPAFIREMIPDSRVASIVEDAKDLIGEKSTVQWDEVSLESQSLAIILTYVKYNNLEIIKSFTSKPSEIMSKFIAFIHDGQLIEEEVSTEAFQSKGNIESIEQTIKELKISPREQEVLDLVIQGLNNREIGEKLYISGHTVKNHVTRIFQKLDVSDRAHAISKVYQLRYEQSHSN